jgi:hypothetical protein
MNRSERVRISPVGGIDKRRSSPVYLKELVS